MSLVVIVAVMVVAIMVIVCGRHGLWPSWFVSMLVKPLLESLESKIGRSVEQKL